MAAKLPADSQWRDRPQIADLNETLWRAMLSTDQLRQRWMFSLSQMFVVSITDGSVYYLGTGVAAYVDMLYAKGFGNFRDLIEGVTRSTAMGAFLGHLYNRKEDPSTGARPDQNFARELMQLFTIGLWQLNPDGTFQLDAQGQRIPTYGQTDIEGVSRVMTGWAFDVTEAQLVRGNGTSLFDSARDTPIQERPMRAFPAYHSTLEKRFLGVTIAASTSPDPVGNLRVLLDTLFNHPNTGPFLSRQLIQRLVTSNPSRGYIRRVAAAFANNGSGVRGDMKAVIKAILLDPEARDPALVSWPLYGRLREPIGRMMQLMRVLNARTEANPDSLGISMWLYDKRKGLWQTPMAAPSVFNFFSPTHMPPRSALAAQSLTSPEMQITTQSSIDDIQWFFADLLQNGGLTDCCSDALRNTFRLRLDYSEWLPLVANPPLLATRLSEVFCAGQLSATAKSAIVRAVNEQSNGRSPTSGMVRGVTQLKLAAALLHLLVTPEYIVQK
jgi:uncharacterized protein (DUF1800 family)